MDEKLEKRLMGNLLSVSVLDGDIRPLPKPRTSFSEGDYKPDYGGPLDIQELVSYNLASLACQGGCVVDDILGIKFRMSCVEDVAAVAEELRFLGEACCRAECEENAAIFGAIAGVYSNVLDTYLSEP